MTTDGDLVPDTGRFDPETDVVVVGGGGCGLTAAIAAAQGGAEVLVLEKQDRPACNTARSGGMVPAAGSRFQRAAGIVEAPEAMAEDILRKNGRASDPLIRQRLADAWIGLEIMRTNALRVLSERSGAATAPAAMITKLYWSNWHRSLGELAMDVLGPEAEIGDAFPYELNGLQRLFLFTRSDTIYAGSNEIQRNLIAERALGLPREQRA